MVWIVDAEPGRVVLFTPPDHVTILGSGDSLDGGDALPGFQCRIDELFVRARGARRRAERGRRRRLRPSSGGTLAS